jgi:HK97 family phage major capsid protein
MERAAIAEESRKLLDAAKRESRELNAVEERAFEANKRTLTAIGTEIEQVRAEFTELAQRALGQVGAESRAVTAQTTVLTREQRVADWTRVRGGNTEEYEGLRFGDYVRSMVTGPRTDAERRAMAEGSSTAGGYMVPDLLAGNVIDIARNEAVVFRAGAQTIPMESSKLTIAKVTGDASSGWKAENAAATASDMTLGALTFNARTLMALVKMSRELFDDAPNISDLVQNAVAKSLALELDRASLSGIGAGVEPQGIRNWAGIQTIDKAGAAITSFAEFSDAVRKVQEKNGTPNAAVFAPRTANEIDKLVDTTNQPLQSPPSWGTLQKYVSNQIPITIGAGNNKSEAYVADWRQLLIGIRTQVQVDVTQIAADSSGSAFNNLQVWIRAFLRADVILARDDQFVLIDNIA